MAECCLVAFVGSRGVYCIVGRRLGRQLLDCCRPKLILAAQFLEQNREVKHGPIALCCSVPRPKHLPHLTTCTHGSSSGQRGPALDEIEISKQFRPTSYTRQLHPSKKLRLPVKVRRSRAAASNSHLGLGLYEDELKRIPGGVFSCHPPPPKFPELLAALCARSASVPAAPSPFRSKQQGDHHPQSPSPPPSASTPTITH